MSLMNHHTTFAARLMLVLAVLQFVFVALEAAGVIHGAENTDYHHETLLADNQAESPADDEVDASGPVTEACDHCHHCHGHGSHLAPLSSGHLLSAAPSSVDPYSDDPDLKSIFIHSIHRPPIA